MRLHLTLDVQAADPVAVAAFLLGPAPSSHTLALPVALPLEQQIAQVVRESVTEHFATAREHTGIVLDQIRVTLGG